MNDSLIDNYVAASGADYSTAQDFRFLLRDIKTQLPTVSRDPKQAVAQIRRELLKTWGRRNSNVYRIDSFTLQDVLNGRKGNCLGLPLLIGAIMAEYGITPKFQVLVRPQDVRKDLEDKFYGDLSSGHHEVGYDGREKLALRKNKPNTLIHSFSPLEHLVIDINGDLLEMTTKDQNIIRGFESARPVSFNEALSFVLQSKATDEWDNHKSMFARTFAEKGLYLWPNNRELYSILAEIALENFDDESYESAMRRYSEIDGNDSLFFSRMADLSCDREQKKKYILESLKKYPAYASARADMASILAEEGDKREAKFEFALASHLFANSNVLDIGDFYASFADQLMILFDKRDILKGLNSDKKSGFKYNLARYNLTGEEKYLCEAKEGARTPIETLCYVAASRGSKFFQQSDLDRMTERHKGSKLYMRYFRND